MKISAFLLFVGIIELIADPGYSQNTRITIDLKNTTIEDVLNKIEDVSEFYFLFNQKLIDVDKKVDIMAQNEPIKDILGKIFPENVKYVVSNRQIVLTPADEQYALASIMQQGSVTGIVKDASTGEPMPGVNISIKGTNTGTITDAEGRFSIEIANRDVTIVISFIGYATQEVNLDGRSNLDIAMVSEMMDLEEIVVTAYGTTKRSAIAGSVAVVNNRTIEINKSTNITSTLQGLIPGVQVVATSGQPGAVQDILIRGIGSMAASSSPLYIVDGVPFDLSLNSIPTSDIQSISVLKDASASSLYGAHAANGVVLITTKKGSSDKPKIDFFTILSTSELAVPYPEKASIQTQWETVWQGLYNDATDFLGMNDADARQYAVNNVSGAFYAPMPVTLPNETTRQYRSGWNTDFPIGLDGKLKADAKRLWNFDNYEFSFKHRISQNYGISASGSFNEKNKYYVSATWVKDLGAYAGDDYSQASGRVVLDSKLTKWLDMSLSTLYSSSNNKNLNFDVRPNRTLSREYSFYIYDHATDTYLTRPMIPEQLAFRTYDETGGLGYFPDILQFYSDKDDRSQNLNTTGSLTANILKGLTFKTVYSYQAYNNYRRQNYPPDNGSKLDLPENGWIDRSSSNAVTNYFNNIITFDRTLSQDHHFNAILGQEAYLYKSNYVYASRAGLALPFFEELDQATTYPGVSSGSDTYNLISYFAKAAYDYKNRYFLTASYRTDGSSRFAPEKRWGNFFSAGVAWMISREDFMSSASNWLNNLKLKASYGELGNDNIGTYYGFQSLYGVGGNYYGNLGVEPVQMANPDLQWETNINMNAGIEFTLFKKLSGSFEIFQRKSKDLLLDTPLPTSTGRYSVVRNIGDLQNTGYEIELSYGLLNTEHTKWSINANATHYENKITSLPYGAKMSQIDFTGEAGVAWYKWVVGGSRYDIYCSDWAGINPANGRNQWWLYTFDEDGNVVNKTLTEKFSEVNNENQRINVGSSLPKLFGSFGTEFQYRNVDLSLMFIYSLGGKLYDYNFAESSVLRQMWAVYDFVLEDTWKQPGDVAKYPKIYEFRSGAAFSRQNIGSSQFIFTNNFTRLKNLVIGYNLPKTLSSKLYLANMRVYFRGENLFTTGELARHGTDPEAGGLWGQNKSGLTYYGVRKYNLGLNITF